MWKRGQSPFPFLFKLRTLRHEICPTAYSRIRTVPKNGPFAGFRGHYDTKSARERIPASLLSGKMALPPVPVDITTRNQRGNVFPHPYCPQEQRCKKYRGTNAACGRASTPDSFDIIVKVIFYIQLFLFRRKDYICTI